MQRHSELRYFKENECFIGDICLLIFYFCSKDIFVFENWKQVLFTNLCIDTISKQLTVILNNFQQFRL